MAVYRKNFLSKLLKLKSKIAREKDREAAKEYMRIEKFVSNCSYSRYRKAKDLVSYTLRGKSSSQCAVYLQTTDSTVREHLRELSNELFLIFGEDIFDLFDDFSLNAKEIRKRIYISDHFSNTSSDYLFNDILMLFPKSEKKVKYSVYDCQEELKFLTKHSKSIVQQELSNLNPSKLEFLLGVLDKRYGTVDEQFNFIKLLETKEDEEDVFANL